MSPVRDAFHIPVSTSCASPNAELNLRQTQTILRTYSIQRVFFPVKQKEIKMITRYQGFALIVSAIVSLITYFVDAPAFINIAATLLFIYGISAVHPFQSKGSMLGLVGMGLIILAAAIVIGFRAGLVGDTISGTLIFVSAYSGMIGRVITGWLTINKKSFPAWVGGALIAEGVLNVIPLDFLAIIVVLAGAAAQLGYGVPMSQKK
jgi:hypothetical protein